MRSCQQRSFGISIICFFLVGLICFSWSMPRGLGQELNEETRPLVSAAMLHFQKKEWAQAEKAFEKVVAKDNTLIPAWFRLGVCQQQLEKHEQALESFRHCLSHQGMRASAMYNSACIYAQASKDEEALKWLEDAVKAGFSNYSLLQSSKSFEKLVDHERYQKAASTCKANADKINANKMKVAILVYDGVELLDFTGPGEVFSICRNAMGAPAFDVFTVAPTDEPITSNGFLMVKPNYSLETAPQPDILVVPGGSTLSAENNKELIAWLAKTSAKSKKVMSVCTGVFLLNRAELLNGLEVTTHWRAIKSLKEVAKDRFKVNENVRFVDSKKILTSAGVSAGIDGALHLVEQFHGKKIRDMTARQMQYETSPARTKITEKQ